MATIASRPGLITRKDQQTIRACKNCDSFFIPKRATQGIFCSVICKISSARKEYREVKDGYVIVYPPIHNYPGVRKDGRILEHRLVMQEFLGRNLLSTETVHHKNGDTMDNRIDNLELRSGNHGRGSTHSHCGTCTCFEGVM